MPAALFCEVLLVVDLLASKAVNERVWSPCCSCSQPSFDTYTERHTKGFHTTEYQHQAHEAGSRLVVKFRVRFCAGLCLCVCVGGTAKRAMTIAGLLLPFCTSRRRPLRRVGLGEAEGSCSLCAFNLPLPHVLCGREAENNGLHKTALYLESVTRAEIATS